MDLTLWMTLVSLAVCNGVPPDGPKFLPVFVSPDTIKHLNEKDKAVNGNIGNQPNNDSGHDALINQRSAQNDYDIRNDNQVGYNAAPVYEQQDHGNDMHQAQAQYQQGPVQPQYQQPQQYIIQQPPNPIQQQQPYQIIQQPGQIQQPYHINPQQTQQQQPILLAQIPQSNPPIYTNQQQMGSLQIQQPISNQPILLNQQQYPNQPVQTFQQPNQQTLLISQPMSQQIGQPNGQILLSQPLQHQQAILLQTSQNPQPLISPNFVTPGFSPSTNQLQQNQNGNVYTVIPVNNQNVPIPNQNTNTYLVPVQQLPNQVYAVNAG